MADFLTAHKLSSTNEGGYVNDPNDMGGETYRGISRKYHPEWNGWAVIDSYKNHLQLFKGYTEPKLDALAQLYYKENFWNTPFNLDLAKDQQVANQLYDETFNGPARVVKIAKDILNKKFGKNYTIDSTIKPYLIVDINAADQPTFFDQFKKYRTANFKFLAASLPESDPLYSFFESIGNNQYTSNQKYLNGWLNRVNKYVWSPIVDAANYATDTVKKKPLATALIVVSIFFLITAIKSKRK